MESISKNSTHGLMTFDVEDWHHANFRQLSSRQSAIASSVASAAYPIEKNIDRWIETMGTHGAKSTCFVLGEFAEKFPSAVRKILSSGHEVACHGLTHELVYEMRQEKFREWLTRAMGLLGEVTGKAPNGFRAPSWSVSEKRTPWFPEELERAGILYDSSQFPIKTPLFGDPDAPMAPHRQGGLIRFPVPMIRILGARIPFSSGAFFRLAPAWLIRLGFSQNLAAGIPPMIVLHPRELDPNHPRLPMRGWESWVHYARMETVLPKLRGALSQIRWISIAEHLRSEKEHLHAL